MLCNLCMRYYTVHKTEFEFELVLTDSTDGTDRTDGREISNIQTFCIFLFLFLSDFFFRGKWSCVECMGLKRKCGMMEKESQKSSTRKTKRKRMEDDDGEDDEEWPRLMRVGEIVGMMESFMEHLEAWERKLEEKQQTDRDWHKKMMEQLEVFNSYAEALKGNMDFQYKE